MNERSRIHVYEYKILGNVEASQTTRIPRDITCSFIQRCFIDKYLHVFRAGRKRGNRASSSIDRASIFETDPRARRGVVSISRESAWYARRRLVKTARFVARDQRHLHTERNRRLSKSFVYILRARPSGKTRGSRDCRVLPPPPPLPIYGNLIIYLV